MVNLYKRKTLRKIKKKLKILKKHDLLKFYKSYGSYYGYLKKVKNLERNFKMKSIEKYDYYKKQRSNRIIFIKEGSFYKTYKDDAIIIWDLFGYKWNNDAIAFGVVPSSKVFDFLRSKNLSYSVITDDEVIVQGNDQVYDLYKQLAIINYAKFKKQETLYKLLDEVLKKDINFIDKMIENLKKELEK